MKLAKSSHLQSTFAKKNLIDLLSITVIASNIYDADRFATAAFAMGRQDIQFIESINGLEGYMIDKDGVGTMTTGFERYTTNL